jgi:hypothetical protein
VSKTQKVGGDTPLKTREDLLRMIDRLHCELAAQKAEHDRQMREMVKRMELLAANRYRA